MGQIIVDKKAGGIEGLCVITLAVHGDSRGYFMETYSQIDMADITFVQDNHPNDEGGMAWNNPETGIVWPKVAGEYQWAAPAEGYNIDGVKLDFSDKDQKWLGLKDTFKF